MLSALRSAVSARASTRAFSTTSSRAVDMARLTLIGRLGKDPEVRTTRTEKEYVSYVVATKGPPGPPNEDGSREDGKTTWHSVLSFSPGQNGYLRTLKKGSHVYVEANYEIREPVPDADPSTPQGQRSIFLRHENIRVLKAAKAHEESESHTS